MNKCPLKKCDKEKCGWWDKFLGGCGYDWNYDTERDKKIDFIVENHPEFTDETPDEFRKIERERLNKLTDKELDDEVEWVDYLLSK